MPAHKNSKLERPEDEIRPPKLCVSFQPTVTSPTENQLLCRIAANILIFASHYERNISTAFSKCCVMLFMLVDLKHLTELFEFLKSCSQPQMRTNLQCTSLISAITQVRALKRNKYKIRRGNFSPLLCLRQTANK